MSGGRNGLRRNEGRSVLWNGQDRMRALLTSIFPAIAGILCSAALPFLADAQDLKKLEPLPVPPQVGPPHAPLEPPPPPALPHQDERVIVEALRGLVFLDRKEAVVPKVEMPPGGIDVLRLPRLRTPEFRKLVAPYLGKPVSMAALDRLIKGIYAYYSAMDLPFVSATLPEQDITTGVVQILVVEGGLGRLRVEGAKWFSEDLYRSAIRLRPNEPIRLSVLNEDVAWINKNPFRRANIFFDQGDTVGGTDLVLRTQERLPLRAYAGYNNNGSESTDRNQYLAGFNWGNAFGLGHQLNYQYTSSPDFRELQGHSGSYAIPLPWRDTLTFSGAYSKIKPDMAAPFERDGMSGQASLRYDADLAPVGPLRQAVAMLLEYKVTDNNLLFGGIPVTDNRTDIVQLSGIYSGGFADSWGANTFGLRLTASPGRMTGRNKTEYFEISRASAKADYFYGTMDLARTQPLPANFSLQVNGHLQLASGNLLGSEQLGLGGVNSVRGFNEGTVYGDQGYLLRTELHAPPLDSGSWFPFVAPSMPLDLLVFYDYGTTGNISRLTDEARWNTLKSAGVGFRLAVDRYISVSFDYGWRLAEYGDASYGSHGHFSLIISY